MRRLLACIGLTIASIARVGQAGDVATAQTLFDDAKKLAAEGDCEHALPKFAASHKLDPSVGPLLNMGQCHELMGRTASAWTRFVEAQALAKERGDQQREEYARKRANALGPKLVRLTIRANLASPGLVVHRDGLVVDDAALGVAVPIDPGEHFIEASAPKRRTIRYRVVASLPGDSLVVEIPTLDVIPIEPTRTSIIKRNFAIVTAGLAVGGLAIGSFFGLAARSKWVDAQSTCNDTGCPPSGQSLASDARLYARVSNVSFAVAGLSAIASTVLYLSFRSDDVRVGASIDGFTLIGRF